MYEQIWNALSLSKHRYFFECQTQRRRQNFLSLYYGDSGDSQIPNPYLFRINLFKTKCYQQSY